MKIYFNTKTFDTLLKSSKIQITDKPEEADLLVLGAKRLDYPQFINLKAVYRFGVGTDNIDFEFFKKVSIPIYFPSEKAKAILYDSTANFTVYGILQLLYNGTFGNIDTWTKKQRDYIGDKIALVIGTGNIGQRVVDKLKVFMRVNTYDALFNRVEELEPLINISDVVTVHLPLNKQTKNFFDLQKISWIKDGAIIVNTARGDLFDEDALFEKLSKSNCRAFFDVFWEEPYQGRLKDLGSGKFLMSPHSAGNTNEFVRESFEDIVKITEGLKNGKT